MLKFISVFLSPVLPWALGHFRGASGKMGVGSWPLLCSFFPPRQSRGGGGGLRWKSKAKSGREGKDPQMVYISPDVHPPYSSTPSP